MSVTDTASTETRPETNAPESEGVTTKTSVDGVLGTGDHKAVGRLFIIGGVIGLIGGLVLAVVAVFLANNFANTTEYLAAIWSLSRDLALFGGLVPILVGLAVYLVPLQIGAPSLAFPRGAAASLWTWFLGMDLLILAYVFNGGPGGGRADLVVLWAASLAMMIGGLVWAMVCIATSIMGARTKGMLMERVPLTTWSFFVFSLVGLFTLPITMAELLLAYLRVRYLHLPVTESAELTAVMDGISLAPAIYWLGIPVLGMAVDIIGVHTGKPVKFHQSVMVAIGLFGLLTFGADLVGLASVRGVDFNNGLLVVGLIVIILPVLAVLAMAGESIRNGSFIPRGPLLGALLSGLLLLSATLVSLLGLVEPIMRFIDTNITDEIDMSNSLVLNGTRFHEGIRALVMGAVLVGVIAALHHWAPKIWGRRMGEPFGFLSMAAAAAGSVVWAVGEVAAGFDDQTWLPTPATDDFASGLAAVSLIGAIIMAAGAALLGANLAVSFLGRKPVGSSPNTWSGTTLEWATASPPVDGNFPAPPIVSSATPLADGELRYVGIEAAGEGEGTPASSGSE